MVKVNVVMLMYGWNFELCREGGYAKNVMKNAKLKEGKQNG
jgi:hypothetical protein